MKITLILYIFVCEPKSFSKIFREGAFTKIFEKDFGVSLRLFIHVHIRVELHKIQRSSTYTYKTHKCKSDYIVDVLHSYIFCKLFWGGFWVVSVYSLYWHDCMVRS